MPSVVYKDEVKYISPLVDVSGTTPTEVARALPENVKYVPVKIVIYNSDSSDHVVTLGSYNITSGSWVEDKLVIKVLAGQMLVLNEDDIPSDFVITTDSNNALMGWYAKLDSSVTNPVKVKAEFRLM